MLREIKGYLYATIGMVVLIALLGFSAGLAFSIFKHAMIFGASLI